MKPALEQAPGPVEVAPVRRGATILHVNGTGQKHWGYWAKDPHGFFVNVGDEYWEWYRREGPEYWPTLDHVRQGVVLGLVGPSWNGMPRRRPGGGL